MRPPHCPLRVSCIASAGRVRVEADTCGDQGERSVILVQRLQVARRDLEFEAAISKLDKYQLLIHDDITYVTKDQAETSVMFELIAARYERRSLLITVNHHSANGD